MGGGGISFSLKNIPSLDLLSENISSLDLLSISLIRKVHLYLFYCWSHFYTVV